ncbi:LysR family transcriptional regulator [Bowmanella dokdonensis]|uniref:LysR family transcriptional regulator n=1 Tax=Bowmanella dokdonensis TaxID=751969 RepID=A0A939DSN6_9ALTE|nr:LysR family transcriptional regulator [Bowmanella dokdonensis]MBN7827637.1 LysR family transcriptional regulator [Bowmanella dokdonensis]
MLNQRKLRQVSNLDLKLLKTFIAVVQAGSFTGAEGVLNLSRSAISIYISDLEKRLGMKLCSRGRGGFSLTLEGQTVYDAALRLMGAAEQFQDEVNNTYSVLKGELNIGIIDNLVTIPHRTISKALSTLKRTSKEVRVNIRMSNPADITLALLEGELDVGVMPSLTPIDGLKLKPLYSETSSLYCSDEHPLFDQQESVKSIQQHAAVLPVYAEQMNLPDLFDKLQVAATSNDREGVAFLVLTHEYIGFLPDHYASRWVDKGEMRALLPRQFNYSTDFYIATRQAQRNRRVLDVFLQALETL